MKTEVPLWGTALTSFAVLFAVGFYNFGFTGAIGFCWCVIGRIIAIALTLVALVALVCALAVAVYSFVEGFKRVRGERHEWYFVNRLCCSFVLVAWGFLFLHISSEYLWVPSILPDTMSICALWAVYWKIYLVALLVSLTIRSWNKKWCGDW
jgi:hypothetical protein